MNRPTTALAAAAVLAFVIGCETGTDPVPPDTPESVLGGGVTHSANGTRLVALMDACDPESFNAAFGPGTCIRNGGVTLEKFIEQLEKHQRAGGWFQAPKLMSAKVGDDLLAVNRGGEVHTFTEVAQFGGGFIDFLNQLTGTPIPAPECLTLEGGDFVPPGGTFPESVSGPGQVHFQCCIHPWMRTTVMTR